MDARSGETHRESIGINIESISTQAKTPQFYKSRRENHPLCLGDQTPSAILSSVHQSSLLVESLLNDRDEILRYHGLRHDCSGCKCHLCPCQGLVSDICAIHQPRWIHSDFAVPGRALNAVLRIPSSAHDNPSPLLGEHRIAMIRR